MSLFVDQGTKAEVGTQAEAGRGDIRHAADERRHEVGRWVSSETDPAKVWDFDDNNSWIKNFF